MIAYRILTCSQKLTEASLIYLVDQKLRTEKDEEKETRN